MCIMGLSCCVLKVRRQGKHQGRVVELVPRSSFDISQGCTNSRPGRLRIPEVMQSNGLGFSLCAVLLDIVRSCISEQHGSEPQQGEQRSGVFQTGVK